MTTLSAVQKMQQACKQAHIALKWVADHSYAGGKSFGSVEPVKSALAAIAALNPADFEQSAPVPVIAPTEVTWQEAERVSDLPRVDEVIRGFLEDPTGDNATCMVRAILQTSVAPVIAQGEREAPSKEYGETDFGFTFAGIQLEEGDKRLATLIVNALGTAHPAMDDLVSLLFRARAALSQPAKVEQTDSDAQDALNLLKRLKSDLMHTRRFAPDTLQEWRKACTSAEGDIEEYLLAVAKQRRDASLQGKEVK